VRFDWYAATVRDDLDSVVGVLEANLDARPVELGRGLHGYTRSFELRGRDGVAARVLGGGTNPWPHAWATGADTEPFVDTVRTVWPDWHSVSRVDAAEDFGSEGCWDRLLAECVAEVQCRNLSIDQAGDWLMDGQAGRTFYIGAKSSPVRARLYEKGKQLRGQGLTDAPIDWVRLELQVRPDNEAKWTLAKATPEETWGASRWSRELAWSVLKQNLPKIDGQVWHEPDDVRALRYMIKQYGPLLAKLRVSEGSWDAVGRRLGWSLGGSVTEGLSVC